MLDYKNYFFFPIVTILGLILAGCTVTSHPRPRPGSYAASSVRVRFLDPNSLGNHNYGSFIGEKDGVVYTCRGGHIDIAHLRIAADNVYYLQDKISRHLKAGDPGFTYKLNTDPSIFVFHIVYPPGFKSLSQRQREQMIYEVSLELAQYGAWQLVTWHEALTWFGMKAFVVFPQFQSAFAWEDTYSNLLGITLGAKAIRHPSSDFNVAMTVVLDGELDKLGVQSKDFAYTATEKMRDKWYRGNVDVTILLRNLDIGLDDGFVSPVLVPDVCRQARPVKYPIPNLNTATRYGFKVKLEITSTDGATNRCREVIFPGGSGGPIVPAVHLPILMKTIRRQAIEKGFIVMP